MQFEGKKDKELIELAKSLHQSIQVSKVFNSEDAIVFDAVCSELERRGYAMVESIDFVKQEEKGKKGKKEKKEIRFENAQELAKRYPETFGAPSAEDLKSIKVGDFVKVCAGDERFWVEVEKMSKGTIYGRVDNNLIRVDVHGLAYNSRVRLKPENIYSIIHRKEVMRSGSTEKGNDKSSDCGPFC